MSPFAQGIFVQLGHVSVIFSDYYLQVALYQIFGDLEKIVVLCNKVYIHILPASNRCHAKFLKWTLDSRIRYWPQYVTVENIGTGPDHDGLVSYNVNYDESDIYNTEGNSRDLLFKVIRR